MPADPEVAPASDQPGAPSPEPTLSEDLVAMLDRLAQTIVDVLGFGVAVVNLVRPGDRLEVVSVAGDEDARAVLLGTTEGSARWDRMLAVSESWGALCFIDHRNEAATADIFSWVPEMEIGLDPAAWHPEDALFAPLVASDGSRLGVLSVDLPPGGRRPTPATCRALEAFAISAALAVEHATLRQRAEASEARYRLLASQDQLTGIANRSSIIDDLGRTSQSHNQGQEQGQSLEALAFLDLDGFKQINDQYSHLAGDHVLRTIASRLKRRLRPGDQVGRWGGDEFLVLLRRLESERDALVVLERLSAAVAEPITYGEHELRLTVSVGVAFLDPGEELDLEDLVRRADAAMYRVKRAGRNAIVVDDAPPG
ncbi:GGDEF domain-containing protein [Microlunatus antarcticus]|uniref:Diguanylate cyclase (GGDEF)-like protein n=1 Tax=Microlunatus antarcticus TaxID=53388 RepID=A0A7W5JUR8_9ACTN|nr:sensor domain-containing diguanylate cyclase [Microlunatus antarcticus]MBB3326638.1 diguanylate cyclase (GGDEF)-like protein [Microlunatus antarcticus]